MAVASTGSAVYTSPDGLSWTQISNAVPTGELAVVRWGGTRFVAVGQNERILTSPDGLTWTTESSTGAGGLLQGIAWTGERLVVVGEDSRTWRSGCDSRALTVELSGSGSGIVTSDPPGIACGSDCSELFFFDESVMLTPTPGAHSVFSHWGGEADCADGSVTMTTDRTCEASFDLTSYLLTVTLGGTGTGSVTSTPPGINCGADCVEPFTYGTTVTLTPAAGGGASFLGWSGDADCADGEVTMAGNLTCMAAFDLNNYVLTVTMAGPGAGSVTSAPQGIECGADCSEPFAYGTSVTLTPTASGGSTFVAWTGDPDCEDGLILVDEPTSCTAEFALLSPTIFADGFETGDTSAWSITSP